MGNRSPYPYPDDGLTRRDVPAIWPRPGDSPYGQGPYSGYPPPPPQPPRRRRHIGRTVLLTIGGVVVVLLALAAIAPKRPTGGLLAVGTATPAPPTQTPTPKPPTATPQPAITASLLYNNVGISDDHTPTTGNFDVFGDSYSAQALASAGLVPGQPFTYNGVRFIWPEAQAGAADNMQVQSQSVTVNSVGAASTLAFLGAGHFGAVQCTITIVYRDGTKQTAMMGLSDWSLPFGAIQFSNAIAATLPYYNHAAGMVKQNRYIFYTQVALKSSQPIVRIDFPQVASLAQMHLFTIGVK